MSKFYTIDEVSELIDVPADVIREWVSEGKVSASRRAGDVVLRHHDVQRLLSEYGRSEDGDNKTAGTAKSDSQSGAAQGYMGAQDSSSDPASYYGYPDPEPEPEEQPIQEPTSAFKAPTSPMGRNMGAAVPVSERVAPSTQPASDSVDGKSTLSISAPPITFESLTGIAPVALDYSSFYDRDLDEYESQMRYLEMELPLRSSGTEKNLSNSNLDKNNVKASGASAAIDGAQLEQAIERAVEPLARAQARLIKLFNETREESRRLSSLPASGGISTDKALARIEEKLAHLPSNSAPVEAESKSIRIFAETLVSSLRQDLASLRTFCIERFNSINSGTAELPKDIIENFEEIRSTLGKMEAKQENVGSAALGNLQKKYDLLTQKYNNLRTEHERMAKEHSEVSESGANVDSILNRLEVLRAPLDAYGMNVGDFMEKIVSYVDELSCAKRELTKQCSVLEQKYNDCEAKYEACEEESSTFQVLISNLQKDNRILKDECERLKKENAQAKDDFDELESLRETCQQLQSTASGSDEAFGKLQQDYISLQEQNKELQKKARDYSAEIERIKSQLQDNRSDNDAQASALQAELEKRDNDIKDLKARFEEVSVQLKKANQECNDSASELDEIKALLEEAKNEAEEARKQLDHSNTAYDDLSEAYKKKEEEAEGAKAELVQMQTVVKSTKAQSAELENMAAEAHKETSEALAKLKEAEARLEEAEKEFGEQQAKVEEAESAREELRLQLENAQAEAEELLAKAQDENRQSLEKLQQELTQAKAQALASQAEFDKQTADIVQREKSLQENASRLESEKSRLLRRINTLQAKNEALQAEIEESHEFGDDYDAVKAVEVRMQDRLDAVNLELNETKAKLKEYETKAGEGGSSKELNEALSQLNKLKAENDSLRYELSVRSDSDSLQKQSAQMLEALANFEAENAEKDRLIEESHQDRARLREELERTKQSLFEQQQLYERERKEWSEILAKQVKGESIDTGADPLRRGGFKLFRNRGGSV